MSVFSFRSPVSSVHSYWELETGNVERENTITFPADSSRDGTIRAPMLISQIVEILYVALVVPAA